METANGLCGCGPPEGATPWPSLAPIFGIFDSILAGPALAPSRAPAFFPPSAPGGSLTAAAPATPTDSIRPSVRAERLRLPATTLPVVSASVEPPTLFASLLKIPERVSAVMSLNATPAPTPRLSDLLIAPANDH